MGLIRLYLAIAVVIAHNGIETLGISGYYSVNVFFAISGFYMGLVLNEKYTSGIWEFYIARYLRIWPPFFVVFFIVSILSPTKIAYPLMVDAVESVAQSTLILVQGLWWLKVNSLGNLVIVSDVMDNTLALSTRFPHMWSVGIELIFYASAPFFSRSWKRTAAVFAIAYAIHLSIALNLPFHHPIRYRSSIGYFWLFSAGVLAYWIGQWAKTSLPGLRNRVPTVLISLIGVILTAMTIAAARWFDMSRWPDVLANDTLFLLLAVYFRLFSLSRVQANGID